MNVSLSPELERYIHAKVQPGRQNSPSLVVPAAVRSMKKYDGVQAEQLRQSGAGSGTASDSLDAVLESVSASLFLCLV
jgi:putative addiction module CopG family antidote